MYRCYLLGGRLRRKYGATVVDIRKSTLDVIKGVLILLVIIGHITQGELGKTFSRFFIYQFHIPLFFLVSGLLMPTNNLYRSETIDLLKKYTLRLVLPWVAAILVYYVLLSLGKGNYSSITNFNQIIKAFIIPFYHLWYIPAFIIYIFTIRSLLKMFNQNTLAVFFIIVLLSFLGKYLNVYRDSSTIIHLLDYDIRLYNILFLFLGMLINDKWSYINKSFLYLFSLLALIPVMFFLQNTIYYTILWYVLNIGLCFAVAATIKILPNIKNNTFEYLGKNTLSIYLWHVIGILIAKKLSTNNVQYYVISVVLTVFIIISLNLVDKIKTKYQTR